MQRGEKARDGIFRHFFNAVISAQAIARGEKEIEVYEPFNRLTWHLGTAAGSQFVTSDNPIAMWHPEMHEGFPVGLFTAREITFPLDPSKSMLMEWSKRPEQAWTAPEEEVRILNFMTVISAAKHVYAHPSVLQIGLEAVLPPRTAGQ